VAAQAPESGVIICARRKPEEGGFPRLTLMTDTKRDENASFSPGHPAPHFNHGTRAVYQRAPVPGK
jgi:hypothetical protein